MKMACTASAALDAQLARYRAADEAWRACPVPGVDREQFIRRWLARLPVIEWPHKSSAKEQHDH